MINFLPKKLESEVVLEYRLRVLSVFLITVFAVFSFSCLFIIPSYIFSSYKNKVVSNQLSLVKSVRTERNNSLPVEIKMENEIIKVLSFGLNYKFDISNFLEAALVLKNENIKISSISVTKNSQKTGIVIQGVSKTRDGLIMYVRDLKKDGIFSSVDLPVSNLVKSSDVDFVINLGFDKK